MVSFTSSGFASPRMVTSFTSISTRCCFPSLSLRIPFTLIAAPTVILFKVSGLNFSKSITHWMLLMVDPSFNATKRLLLNERTHPLTLNSCKNWSLSPCKGYTLAFVFLVFVFFVVFRNFFFIFWRSNNSHRRFFQGFLVCYTSF